MRSAANLGGCAERGADMRDLLCHAGLLDLWRFLTHVPTEPADRAFVALGLERLRYMPRASGDHEFVRLAASLQRAGKLQRVRRVHGRIVAAVRDEKRRGDAAGPPDGRTFFGNCGAIAMPAAKTSSLEFLAKNSELPTLFGLASLKMHKQNARSHQSSLGSTARLAS